MATRTCYFRTSKKDTTGYVGDKLDYEYYSGTNEAFGRHIPTYISFEFDNSQTYADFSSNVTISYNIQLKINGSWYKVYERSGSMNKSSDFSAYNISLSSTVVSLLQQYAIDKVAIYHAGEKDNRGITAKIYAPCVCTIAYTEVTFTVSQPSKPTVTYDYNTKKFTLNWSPCYGSGGSGSVTYTVYYGEWEDGYRAYSKNTGTSTSTTIDNWYGPYGKSTEYYFSIKAHYEDVSSDYSDYATYIVYSAYLSWEDSVPTPTVSQNGEYIEVSWPAAHVVNGSGSVYYIVRCDNPEVTFETSSTRGSMGVPVYDTRLCIMVTAICDELSLSVRSNDSYITAEKPVVTETHYIIRCYINDSWQDCVVQYYDGVSWIECTPHYYDGSEWKTCSF